MIDWLIDPHHDQGLHHNGSCAQQAVDEPEAWWEEDCPGADLFWRFWHQTILIISPHLLQWSANVIGGHDQQGSLQSWLIEVETDFEEYHLHRWAEYYTSMHYCILSLGCVTHPRVFERLGVAPFPAPPTTNFSGMTGQPVEIQGACFLRVTHPKHPEERKQDRQLFYVWEESVTLSESCFKTLASYYPICIYDVVGI